MNRFYCIIVALALSCALVIIFVIATIDHFFVPVGHHQKMISRFGDIKTLPLVSRNLLNSIEPSNVLIFMIATPEIYEYAQYSIENNQQYAKRYGFLFKIVNRNLERDLPIEFTKLGAILNFMHEFPNVKYIMHIDADASVKNQSYDLRHIIVKYMQGHPNRHFLVAEDCYKRTVCSKPNKMNSGVFIVRNSMIGHNIIAQWLNSARTTCKQWVRRFPNCQNVFEHCVRPKFWPFIKLVPYNLINGVDGLFIEHLMQHKTQDRIDRFKTHQTQNFSGRRVKVY